MCENLSISGINTAGIPDHVMKTLIIDLKFNKKYLWRFQLLNLQVLLKND